MISPKSSALGSPWCCKHKWTIRYITSVVTLSMVLEILQLKGVL